VHPPGVEPGPIAWKAIILPLDQECLMEKLKIKYTIFKASLLKAQKRHFLRVFILCPAILKSRNF
jgi:hypothetical protein